MGSNKKYPLIIFGISFLYCCIFLVFSLQYQQQHDALGYIQHAKDIASSGLWQCNTSKEMGYSILISPLFFFFSTPVAIMLSRLVNIILLSLSSAIFYLTITFLMPNASIKRIFVFSLLFALSPQLASFSALRVYSEPLQLFLNSVILFCIVKIFSGEKRLMIPAGLKFWIIAALSAGYLILTKTFFLFYPLWLLFFILIDVKLIHKISHSFKIIAKPLAMFLCISFLLPFLWNTKNYKKDSNSYITEKFVVNLLQQTHLVEWSFKDELKWGIFQISNNLGEFLFPEDAKRMYVVSGEPATKTFEFLGKFHSGTSPKIIMQSAIREWGRLVINHPFKYILCYCLNTLNQLLFEGVYPDIYPEYKTTLIRYVYLINALILHFLYSMFIWIVIIVGFFIYVAKRKVKLLQQLKLKHGIIVYSLGYYLFFAYHFHTEIRYFYPFYMNIYLFFAFSCNYLLNERKNVASKQK